MRVIFWDKNRETYERVENVCQIGTGRNGSGRCYVCFKDTGYEEYISVPGSQSKGLNGKGSVNKQNNSMDAQWHYAVALVLAAWQKEQEEKQCEIHD